VALVLAAFGCSSRTAGPATPPPAETGGGTAAGGNTSVSGQSSQDGTFAGGTSGGAASSDNLSCVPAQRTIVVAADGSGQFNAVGAALDSVPASNTVPTLVTIRNGVYAERFSLKDKRFITLRGEDRASTRIEAQVGTSTCVDAADGNGCSVLYLEAQDIAFDNLTVANTWTGSGKAIALRTAGAATRIVLRNVDILGKGGDTLMLEKNGVYYVSGVSLSGTYHIIVPRGTTWVSDSTFTCIGHPTCLFNEGTLTETQKMVIVNSTFRGDAPFGLGSYFRDAAWYFIDDFFSVNLLDRPIWRDLNGPSTPYTPLWGERVYFAGSIGPDYAWLRNNIATSDAMSKDQVTLDWVFPTWKPGSSMVCAD
jgi:hypothetical protein